MGRLRHELRDPGGTQTPRQTTLILQPPSYRYLLYTHQFLIPPADRGSCRSPELKRIMIFQVPASPSACHGSWEPSPFLRHGRR